MIPFLAALAVMAALVEVHEPKPKQPPPAACTDTVYVEIYCVVRDAPFPMIDCDTINVWMPGEKP